MPYVDESQFFLKSGRYTEITNDVASLAKGIGGTGQVFVENAFLFLRDAFLPSPQGELRKKLLQTEYLKRSVDQIIKSRYLIACSETAEVFATLCRAKGIPAKFVQTVSLEYLSKETEANIHQHAFVQVFINGRWMITDPTRRKITKEEDHYEDLGYVKFAEGLDHSDLSGEDGKKYSWNSLAEMIADVKKFKEKYKGRGLKSMSERTRGRSEPLEIANRFSGFLSFPEGFDSARVLSFAAELSKRPGFTHIFVSFVGPDALGVFLIFDPSIEGVAFSEFESDINSTLSSFLGSEKANVRRSLSSGTYLVKGFPV